VQCFLIVSAVITTRRSNVKESENEDFVFRARKNNILYYCFNFLLNEYRIDDIILDGYLSPRWVGYYLPIIITL